MANEIGPVGSTAVAAGAGGGGAGGEGGGVATEIDPAAGEGTGEGAGDGAGAGDESGEPGDGSGESDGEGAGEGDKAGAEGDQAEGDGSEFETDGRKIDDKTKKALAALKKVDPESAKLVAEAYFRHDAYKKVFATVHDARGAKATIEALGGQEGIQELQSEVTDYRGEIEQFAKGDPALINNLWEANPEGVELSTAASIELLGQKSAEAFDRVIIPPMVARLEKAKFFGAMTQLSEHIKAGEGQKAYDLLAEMGKFFTEAKALQKKQLDLKSRVDPDREKFNREKQEFETEKTKEYEGRISTNANTLNNRVMSKIVEPFFKEMKLPTEGRREFIQGLQTKVWAAMKADKAFQTQARTIQKNGDAAETAEFIHEKFAELLPGIFRSYRNWLYPNYARLKTVKPNGDGGAANEKTPPQGGGDKKIVVAQGARPKHSDVDWTKTSDLDWIRGKAVLTNGKAISFDKNAPPNRM